MPKLSKPWYDAVLWLVYTLVGALFAVGIAGVAAASKDQFALKDFTDGGQFGVYTAGMIVSIYYVLHRPTVLRIPFTEWFGIIVLISLAASAAIVTLSTLAVDDQSINPQLFRWPGIALFLISTLLAFLAVGWDNERMLIDPRAALSNQLRDLEEDFERTAGRDS